MATLSELRREILGETANEKPVSMSELRREILGDTVGEEDSTLELTGKALKRQPLLFGQSLVGMTRQLSPINPPPQIPGESEAEYGGRITEWESNKGKVDEDLKQVSDDIASSLKELNPNFGDNSAKKYGFMAAESMMQMAPMIGTALLTRGTIAPLMVMGTQVYGRSYDDALRDGRSPGQASMDATFRVAAEVLPEKIPLAFLLKEGGKLTGRIFKSMGLEGAQEVFTEGLNSAYDAGIVGKEMTLGEALERMKEAGIVGALTGGGLALATQPFVKGAKEVEDEKAKQAKDLEAAIAGDKLIMKDQGEFSSSDKLIDAARKLPEDLEKGESLAMPRKPDLPPGIQVIMEDEKATNKVKVKDIEGADYVIEKYSDPENFLTTSEDKKIKVANRIIKEKKLTLQDFVVPQFPEGAAGESIVTNEDELSIGEINSIKENQRKAESEEAKEAEKRAANVELIESMRATQFPEDTKTDAEKTVEAAQSTRPEGVKVPVLNQRVQTYLGDLKEGDTLSTARIQEAIGGATRDSAFEVMDRLSELGMVEKTKDGTFKRTAKAPSWGAMRFGRPDYIFNSRMAKAVAIAPNNITDLNSWRNYLQQKGVPQNEIEYYFSQQQEGEMPKEKLSSIIKGEMKSFNTVDLVGTGNSETSAAINDREKLIYDLDGEIERILFPTLSEKNDKNITNLVKSVEDNIKSILKEPGDINTTTLLIDYLQTPNIQRFVDLRPTEFFENQEIKIELDRLVPVLSKRTKELVDEIKKFNEEINKRDEITRYSTYSFKDNLPPHWDYFETFLTAPARKPPGTVTADWLDGHYDYNDIPNPVIRLRGHYGDGKFFLFEAQLPSTRAKMPQELREEGWRQGLKYGLYLAALNEADTFILPGGRLADTVYGGGKAIAQRFTISRNNSPTSNLYKIQNSTHGFSEGTPEGIIKKFKERARGLSEDNEKVLLSLVNEVGKFGSKERMMDIPGLWEALHPKMVNLYEKNYPEYLREYAKTLGLTLEKKEATKALFNSEGHVKGPSDFFSNNTLITKDNFPVWVIKLTPEKRAEIIREGQPFMASSKLPSKAHPQVKEAVKHVMRSIFGEKSDPLVSIIEDITDEQIMAQVVKNGSVAARGATYLDGTSQISSMQDNMSAVLSAYHEAVHMAEILGILNKNEMAILRNPASQKELKAFIRVASREVPTLLGINKRTYDDPSETIAYANEAFAYYELTGKKPTYRLSDKIREFFRRIFDFNYQVGKNAFHSSEEILKAFRNGEMVNREFNIDSNYKGGAMPAVFTNKAPEKGKKQWYVTNQWYKWTGDLTVLADRHPSLRAFYEATRDVMRLRSQLMNKFLVKFEPIGKLSQEEQTLLTNKLEELDRDQRSIRGNEGLPPKVADAMRSIQEGYGQIYQSWKEAVIERYKDNPKVQKELIALMDAAKKVSYLTHSRVGDKAVSVHDKEGNLVWQATYWKSPLSDGTTNKRRDQLIEEAKSKYPNLKVTPHDWTYDMMKKAYGTKAWKELGFLERLSNVMGILEEEKYMKGDKNILQEFFDEMVEEVGKRGFKSFMRQRRNIPGYINNLNREYYLRETLANYGTRGAHFLARLQNEEKLLKAKSSIMDKDVASIADDFYEYASSPTEEYQFLQAIGFHHNLGFGLSSAGINLLQSPMATFPYLSALAGFGRTSSAMSRAFGQASAMAAANLKTGGINFEDRPKSIDPVKWEAIIRAKDAGLLLPNAVSEFGGIPNAPQSMKNLTLERGINKTLEASAYAFNIVENVNRLTAFIAAYDLAQDETIMAKVREQSKGTRYEDLDITPEMFAQMAVEDTQFLMGRDVRPKLYRGFLRVPLQFMDYQTRMLNLWLKAFTQYGGVNKARMVTGLVGMNMLFAGFWGLPGAELMKHLIEAALSKAGDEDYNLEKEMRNMADAAMEGMGLKDLLGSYADTFNDAIWRGAPRIAGLDISRRTALEVIPRWLWSGDAQLSDMLGPSGAMYAGSLQDFFKWKAQGHDAMAWASLLPVALKNIVKSQMAADEGYFSQSGRRIIGEIGLYDELLQSIGFTPAKLAQARELIRDEDRWTKGMSTLKESYTERATYLLLKSKLAEQDGNGDKAAYYRKEAEELIREAQARDVGKDPDQKVNINRQTIRDRVNEDFLTLSSKLMANKKAPKKMRRQIDEEFRGYPALTNH